MIERADGTEFEPMTENEREQLAHLIELRDMIRAELVDHGQIEASGSFPRWAPLQSARRCWRSAAAVHTPR